MGEAAQEAHGGHAAGELTLTDVRVAYGAGGDRAVDGCTFHLEPGERVALIGPNGSGKTSLLSAIVGLVPHDGDISVDRVRVDDSSIRAIRTGVGFLFSTPEDQLLFPRVLDDVAFALVSRGVPEADAHAAATRSLARLGVADLAERSPYQLSHGQRLRVALAGVLIGHPPLLLLDEPTGGLDPAGSRLLAEQLSRTRSTTLIATHDLDFAARACARYLLLDSGRIVRDGVDFSEIEL